MTNPYYKLPPDLAEDIDTYEREVQRFVDGDMPSAVLKARRVPRGVYEQRKDGSYMVRVRVAGGTLTAEQAQELAALARKHGNGLLHVTTRQDVQLHEVPLEETPGAMRGLMRVGLTSKGGGGNTVRNVTACPYAGICPKEQFDVTPFAHTVTEYLLPLVGSYNLPRKYKIAFSGCAADCALAQVSDLGFIAEAIQGQPGFRVVAGGGMGGHSRVADLFFDWVPARDVIRISETVRRLFDQLGDRSNKHRARLRYVFERIGVDAFRDRFTKEAQVVADDGVPEWNGKVPLNAPAVEGPCGPPALEVVDGVRCLPQRQADFVAVPLHLPLGFVPADDFAKIGELGMQFSEEKGLRTTRAQNLLIRFVKKENVRRLADELLKLGTDVLAPTPLERFVACAGASTCRLGLCLARGAAQAGSEALHDAGIEADTLDALDIYINGCPNACGHQPVGPVGLFGVAQRSDGRLVPCYRVTLGGRCGSDGARLGTSVGQVPARAMPAFVTNLAADFQSGRSEAESFSAYFDRTGKKHFEAIVERHARVPPYDDSPDFYRDFGVEEDFSLAGRGSGECGSGVFEVIQEDLVAAGKAQKPFEILLPTARALLITRGVDAQDADTVLREFEAHFVDTGLVAEEFRALLARARGFTQGWEQAFDGYEDAVKQLLERVDLLYSTLDANLEFHPTEDDVPSTEMASVEGEGGPRRPRRGPESSQENRRRDAGDHLDRAVLSPSGATPTAPELNLSGVACPMNFVKAKLRLEGMNIGEALAIVLDDGDPIQNVPASFRNEGQTIEQTEDLGDGHWRVVVRKEE